ncbi:glycosyltransferase family 4 protein [Paenibacillus sp. R14(2021)]|uniref:glycosyltransferase family 4 protein n=1 Tax=Paenibacillus sp. R14(2021) TaxID=2859228 RepID=UPI001C6165A2|nr:glycosyltransferase family 4 protein [Paenibacillus sp. R14(2021)]
MKVGHVCTTALSHKIMVDKLALMQAMGYNIHLISDKEGYNPELLKGKNLEVRFLHMKREIAPIADLLSIIRYAMLFRRERYDIIHTHNAKAGVVGRIAGWLSRTPVVVHTTHGLPFFEGQSAKKNKLYRWMERVGALFCHAIASQNFEDIDKVKAIARRKNVYYEGNGVDLEALDQHRQTITLSRLQALRDQWGIKPSVPVMLVGARFEKVKNHDLLLDGLHRLKQAGESFVCLLAGRGELEQSVREKIKAYSLEEQVIIIGHQLDIYAYIELCDIVVLTSEKEGIPRILMEAMAYGKPVVATDVLGTRELVKHEVTGLLTPYPDGGTIAQSLQRLLRDEFLRHRFGREGRYVIERSFTEELVVRRIHSYYRELMTVGRKPILTKMPGLGLHADNRQVESIGQNEQ